MAHVGEKGIPGPHGLGKTPLRFFEPFDFFAELAVQAPDHSVQFCILEQSGCRAEDHGEKGEGKVENIGVVFSQVSHEHPHGPVLGGHGMKKNLPLPIGGCNDDRPVPVHGPGESSIFNEGKHFLFEKGYAGGRIAELEGHVETVMGEDDKGQGLKGNKGTNLSRAFLEQGMKGEFLVHYHGKTEGIHRRFEKAFCRLPLPGKYGQSFFHLLHDISAHHYSLRQQEKCA